MTRSEKILYEHEASLFAEGLWTGSLDSITFFRPCERRISKSETVTYHLPYCNENGRKLLIQFYVFMQ